MSNNYRGADASVDASLAQTIKEETELAIDGIFGPRTRASVVAAQRWFGLPQTGSVNAATWDEIYDQFSGIETTAWRDPQNFPYTSAIQGRTVPRARYSRTSTKTQYPGNNLSTGNQDPVSQEVVR